MSQTEDIPVPVGSSQATSPAVPLGARAVRTIGRDELSANLDWGSSFFNRDSYTVFEWPAIDLLSGCRFDLLAKAVFAEYLIRGVRCDFGERLYAEHIRVWNGFYELMPSKTSRSDFVDSFRALVSAINTNGFSPEKPFVPVDRFGRIIDGAHRVAAGIAAGTTALVVQTEVAARDRQVPDFDYRFFAENRSHVSSGLTEYYSDEMARAYCRLRPQARIVVLFPVANRAHDDRALEVLSVAGTVVYARSFLLSENGALQFVRHLYQHDPRNWLGTTRDGFPGAADKAGRCFKAMAPCRVVLLDPTPGTDLVEVKKHLRKLYGRHDAVHITDNSEELPIVSGFAFNRNSIEFFNRARPRMFDRFDALFQRYSKELELSGVSREDVAVHGSACMAAAGLRDCRDIDFLRFDTVAKQVSTPGVTPRSIDLLVTRDYADSVIFDPANHFWYFGQKFATLGVVRQYKLSRAERGKDPRDVALIDQILRPTKWGRALTAYFSMVGLRRRKLRDALRLLLAKAGLLPTVRRLRQRS